MFTSNYSKCGKSDRAVAISLGVPEWFEGRRYGKLAPTRELFSLSDPAEFNRRFREEVLGKLDARKVREDLGEDAILLCWERPGEWCHRRLVAEWLQEELGEAVPEVGGIQEHLF